MMNPIGNVFCSRCNTRLLPTELQLPEKPKPAEEPTVAVKGLSLPTRLTAKDGASEPEELPDWLLELTEHSLGKTAEGGGITELETADQFPDWLSGLAGDTTDHGIGETPNVSTAGKPAAEKASAFSEVPDWFSELTGDVSAPEEAAPEETAAGATPDWLSDLLEEEEASRPDEVESEPQAEEEPALEELPDWLSDLTPEEPTVAPSPDVYERVPPSPARETAIPISDIAAQPAVELPDWLLATALPSPSGEAPFSQPLPEWLLKNVKEPTSGQEAGGLPGAGRLPAWLMKGAEPGVVPSSPPAPAPPRPEPARVYEEEIEPQATVPAAEAGVEVTPDWLLGIYDEEEVGPQAVAPVEEPTPDVVPDWLLGIYDEEEVEPQAAAPSIEPQEVAAEPGMPDWLSGIYSEEEAEPLATAFTAEPEEEELTPETAMPDWLAGIMTEEPAPEEPEALPEGEGVAHETGIPDWLAGLEAGAPSTEEKQPAPFVEEGATLAEGKQAGPSATPDWLRGVTPIDEELALKPAHPAFITGEAASGASDEEYEAPVLEGGEIPDWLKGLTPAAPGPIEEEATFYERVSEDESLVRAEVPSWLQGLRPPGTEPLPPLPEVMAPGAEVLLPQEGGPVRAEIPDWVQQLRPAPSAEGKAGEKRFLEPAETEGPLAGLLGVLPAGVLMDMPVDFHPAPPLAIPDSIVAQAQLWQKLLEQPRSVQRPVAQYRARSGSGQLATRLIVAVILLAVTMLGLLWSDVPLSQALSRPHIEDFSKAIDALGAGDTAIVAVEYGPAEAGEMTILAEAVVQHLADRNVQMMMVSTLPEGAGLIQGLLEPLALDNHLPEKQTAYLPGSSSGVAQFLTVPSEAKLIVVLAGRGERLRWWVEQNNATQILPMAIGVNAATAPLAMPYLETSPVAGWMTGLPDVAAYQEFRGLASSVLDSQLNALMLAHWAALALLLFGLFYYLALGKKGAS